MKKLPLLLIGLLNVFILSAQRAEIGKQRSLLFITHTVTAKETLYSLGRVYHLSTKDIAAANKLKNDAGLQVGQEVKIPLKKDNFIQSNPKSKKGLQAVYHTVKKGDNLYKLSKDYNRVPESLLKKWNSLSKNVVKPGQAIIVGYLKTTPDHAAPKNDDVAKAKSAGNAKPVIDEQAKQSTVITGEKDNTIQQSTVNSVPKKDAAPAQDDVGVPAKLSTDDSYFAANYSINAANAQEKKYEGVAATFKSTSGWSDKKYYILVNEIAPETIVKVTVNGKSIYAKVLETLPDLKDNRGLLCRLSNAAASALGITDAKFDVEIAFYE